MEVGLIGGEWAARAGEAGETEGNVQAIFNERETAEASENFKTSPPESMGLDQASV